MNDVPVRNGAGPGPGPISSGGFQFGTCGYIVLQEDGNWTYVLDNSDPDTMALAANETAEVFSYTIRDPYGETSTSTLTIEIKGASDDPASFQLLA